MKQASSTRTAALAIAVALAGCAHNKIPESSPPQQEGIYAPAGTTSTVQAGPGTQGMHDQAMGTSGQHGMTGSAAEKQRLCDMHRQIQDAPADEQQALMKRFFPDMSPEARQEHMDAMKEQCP